MSYHRHPGEGRDLVRPTRRLRHAIPAFAGMTVFVASVLATGIAVAQGGPPPAPAPATLASRPHAGEGERLYVEKCVMCHGPNGMGSGLLARRGKGAEPNLEKRTDLAKEFVILAARRGLGNMPAIPRGEVSDADLAKIADYLASGKGPAQ